VDVSQDPRYDILTTNSDAECVEAPARLPEWILPLETQEALFRAGHGTAPDLIYVRGVPDTPSPDPHIFDRKKCNLILLEIGFCQDFGCHKRLQEKTAKYAPLVAALKIIWGKVEFVAVPVGHASTTLQETHRHLAQAVSATRPEIERCRARREVNHPETDTAARTHDSSLFKTLMHTLTKLTQDRLLDIIHHRQSLVYALVGAARRNRANSDATPAQETHEQGGTTHTHTHDARTAHPGEHGHHIAPYNYFHMPLHTCPIGLYTSSGNRCPSCYPLCTGFLSFFSFSLSLSLSLSLSIYIYIYIYIYTHIYIYKYV
jgi:hypothetical protein